VYIYRLLSCCLHAWRHISVGARRLKCIERVVLGRDQGKVHPANITLLLPQSILIIDIINMTVIVCIYTVCFELY
jgi:hypothetical protein